VALLPNSFFFASTLSMSNNYGSEIVHGSHVFLGRIPACMSSNAAPANNTGRQWVSLVFAFSHTE